MTEEIRENASKAVEKSAKEILTKAEKVATTTHSVREGALNVVVAAEKTNTNLIALIEKRNKILDDLHQKYKFLESGGN